MFSNMEMHVAHFTSENRFSMISTLEKINLREGKGKSSTGRKLANHISEGGFVSIIH